MNPIFRLELIQARRRGILLFLFLGGCLIQAVSLFLMFNSDFLSKIAGSWWLGIHLIRLVFQLLPIFIVGGASLKLASQQVNGDPILHTPLSARTILAGKLQTVLVMILCLYLPGIPMIVYRSSDWGINGLLLFPCGVAKLLCWAMIGMGFMAGARSLTLRVMLAGLCVFFFVVLYASTSLLQSMAWNPFVNRYINLTDDFATQLPWAYFFHTVWQYLNLAFLSLLAVLFYGMGAAVMRRNRNLEALMIRSFTAAIILTFVGGVVFTFVAPMTYVPVVFFVVPWAVLVFLPPLALLAVVLHDRRVTTQSEPRP